MKLYQCLGHFFLNVNIAIEKILRKSFKEKKIQKSNLINNEEITFGKISAL